METSQFLRHLARDEARLREVAARDLAAAVPTCPAWAVRDLVEHVAQVYADKVSCMRTGRHAQQPSPAGQPPLARLDQAYATLLGEFAQRTPDVPAFTWYGPDQTVGFWMRRMAHETVIHRVDAETALGEPVTQVEDDLALDGIDEVLRVFLAYGTERWREEFGPELTEADGSTVLVCAGDRSWLVRMDPSGVSVSSADLSSPGPAPSDPAVSGGPVVSDDPAGAGAARAAVAVAGTISGDPHSMLLWLWRRIDAGAVTYRGDSLALGRLRDLLAKVTQ